MNAERINTLFELFSEMPAVCCQSFIVSAERTVCGMTKPEFRNETLLDYLTAAIACSDWKRTHNIVCEKKDQFPEQDIQYAHNLVNEYTKLCSGFMKEGDENETD